MSGFGSICGLTGAARRTWSALCVVVLTALLVGCGPSTSSTQEYSISGLRTDPDGRGLVASYVGGSCDGLARLDVSESDKTLQVRILVSVRDQTCDAAGHARTVVGHLDEPLATRSIMAGVQEMIPFAGARVLRPTTSEATLQVAVEVGTTDQSIAPAPGAKPGPQTTTEWSTSFSDAESPCSVVTVDQRTTSTDYAIPGSTSEGTRQFGTVAAHLYRDGSSDAQATRWTLGWAQDGGSVDVSSEGNCAGGAIIGPDELVKIAASLRPM